jgi:hypothetical protein
VEQDGLMAQAPAEEVGALVDHDGAMLVEGPAVEVAGVYLWIFAVVDLCKDRHRPKTPRAVGE